MASSLPDSNQRRERAAIAAQACETCRSRKSKCDEQRPKCGLCQRLNVECKYREPQPTKKDKTIVFILDGINRLENKIDIIGRHVTPSLFDQSIISPTNQPSSSTSNIISPSSSDVFPSLRRINSARIPLEVSRGYRNLTTPHKVLLWPAISMEMSAKRVGGLNDLQSILETGTPWILRQELIKHPEILPCDRLLESKPALKMGYSDSAAKVIFPELTTDVMRKYTRCYFSTFNNVFPILDQDNFYANILQVVASQGFGDGDFPSIIAFLVFALGSVAEEGCYGIPIKIHSGIRGGSAERPPGLELFNEARRRLGFVMTQCNVENIQCLLLASIYYEACARHPDFWRCTTNAATALQVLLRCEQIEWNSPRGFAIKRVFWTCNMIENWYHIDLDLPRTGICDHEDTVPLPSDSVMISPEQQHNLMHFSAMISLRRLITRIHSTIFEATNYTAETSDEYGGPPIPVINELVRQLDSWRALLPTALQWSDDDRFAHPNAPNLYLPPASSPLFALTQESLRGESSQSAILYILTAQLRSRYYYARFIIYRPFIFKALHYPDHMSSEDRQLAARCLQSALLWPIAMYPCKDRKRLVPMLFAWTQNFLGMLLILRMITVSECMDSIASQYLDETEIKDTVMLLLSWMKDVKEVDGIADWSWPILQSLYSEVPGINDP
ncbi:hypothetical protein K432DRAFT_296919 [Lepidopterella palustris CBS 459.81]|uniref:Zn(2)-C6 fungal-type domain-containing protein n=1 Tax=Lepidopterella palustris CBS 459.81 TaxID=1314670 RepID=A0A8E2EBJ4_9PEZI|nr:hypothetical protein K432DRAFT_296919 [Lepidopterella palustris CBS 459.81]